MDFISCIIKVLVVFFVLELEMLLAFQGVDTSKSFEKDSTSHQHHARGVKSIQGLNYPFHDPYNIEDVKKWTGFHGDIEEFFSISELVEIHKVQKTNAVTGRPAKSPLLRSRKLRIVSTHFSRTDFLKIQYSSIRRFVKDLDWEYIVVNTALDEGSVHFSKAMVIEPNIKSRIRDIASTFDQSRVRHVSVPEESIVSHLETRQDAASRCVNVIQWCLDNLVKDFDGYVLFLDADSFFYDSINIGNLFIEHDIIIGGRNNYRIIEGAKYDYVTNNLLMLDPSRMPDFESFKFGRRISRQIDIDCGAQTYHYFSSHRNLKAKNWWIIYQTVLEYPLNIANNIDHLPSLQSFFLSDKSRYFKDESYSTHLYEDLNVVHYKRGSNWDGRDRRWQLERGKFWSEFWMDYFGCVKNIVSSSDESFDCSVFFVGDSKVKYMELLQKYNKLLENRIS